MATMPEIRIATLSMTKRDLFAAMLVPVVQKEHHEQDTHYIIDDIAAGAVAYADALLAALAKEPTNA